MENIKPIDKKTIDLAYKYPFSNEAKEIIMSSNGQVEQKLLNYGVMRVQNAFDKEKIDFDYSLPYDIKIIHVHSYVYARMLVSALKDIFVVKSFARYEAKKAVVALMEDNEDNIIHISNQLKARMEKIGNIFSMEFVAFLLNSPNTPEFSLIKQNFDKGSVYLTKDMASKFLSRRIELEIMKNLPIPIKDLPQEFISYAKKIKIPEPKTQIKINNQEKYRWIEKLLYHPIADVRHRTVNLILAPYFINIIGTSEEDAIKKIHEYIQRCKELNPDTNVNETYIRYQIRYAKAKGTKPLSFEKAKELLGENILFS